MGKSKYTVKFYTLTGTTFIRVCTRKFWSCIKYSFKTAWQYKAVFKISKYNNR